MEVFVTADLRGWLEPCDCKAGVLGGFPRRASVVAAQRPELLVDAGDLVFQASPYDLLKLRLMLRLAGKLGYAVVNVGRRETEFSREEILEVARESRVPLVSGNLADREGKLVLPGHAIVVVAGVRCGVVGLVSEDSNPGQGLRVLPAGPAIRRQMAQIREKASFVILLSALTTKEMEAILHQVEGIDLVLGGCVPSGSSGLEKLAGVPCFLVQGKGQYLGDIRLSRTDATLRPESAKRIVLGPDLPSDPAILRQIHDFKCALKNLDLLGRRSSDSPYLGADACAACHGEIHGEWQETPHARALESLTPEKGRYDPQCLGCHTTAPGNGGYVSQKETPEFSGVGCESCHGPSRRHASAPLTASRPKTPGQPREVCLTCHQSDHSRPFHAAERLRAIRHWSEAPKTD